MNNVKEFASAYRRLWDKVGGSSMMDIPFPHEVDRVMNRIINKMPLTEQCRTCWEIFHSEPYQDMIVKMREHCKVAHPEVEEI